MELIFQVKNQRLYLNTVNKVVADSKNYLTAAFSFTDDWDGAVKTAQFTKGTTTTNVVLDSTTNTCTVPQAVLSGEGEFYVSVFGSKENGATIITANTIKIEVLPSGFIANPGTISEADAAALQAHADAVTAVTNNSTLSAGGHVHQILFTVRNQSMYLTTRGKIVADSQGYLGAKFLFTDDWDGMIKIAQFKRGGLFYNIRLDENNECTVPWEVLVDEGIFIANVFGNNPQNSANRIITVNPVEVHVEKSGLTEGELPSNPTLGLDGQVLFEIYQYAESAAAAASEAATSATSSQRYATDAGGYASDANTAAGTAESAATSAAASAASAATDAAATANMITEVSNLKTEITALSATVNEAVENMDTYQQSAADSAALAEKWATYTDGTVDGNEFSAKYYAGVSGTQATAASTSATAAATSASAAASSASDAADSAEDAATSETNSANSETNASNSASAAAASATQAAQAATAASSSAGSAAASASNASSSATSASNSATAAATSETNARNSATSAAGSASDASDSADAAASSESNASTYAGNAQTSATNASNSASAAASSATAAAASATTASNAAQTVENYASGFAPLTSPALTGTPSAPTPDTSDNSTKIATTAYVKSNLNSYLPLSGGTMTGNIHWNNINSKTFRVGANTVDDPNSLNIDIGWDWNNRDGSGIGFRSTDHTRSGVFSLYARNATNSCSLEGNPDGTLTWGGEHVAYGVSTGTANGTISVNGSDVPVHGLGSAAYTESSAYAAASHTHSYLPLSGGTLTSGGYIHKKSSQTKGTNPSGTVWILSNIVYDSAGTATANRLSEYRSFVDNNGKVGTEMLAYDFTSGATSNTYLGVYKDLNGATHVDTNGQLVINRNNGSVGGGIKLTGSAQNFAISAQNTNVTKGTAPSSTAFWGIDFYGKDMTGYSNRIGMLETSLDANNLSSTHIRAYNCTTNTNTATCSIGVHVDGNGNAYTSAPTPATGDNSTKIATTNFVNTKASNYLPLAGGTMTGSIYEKGLINFQQMGLSSKGTNPSSWVEQSIRWSDATGNISSEHLLGMVRNEVGNTGNVVTRLIAYKNATDSAENAQIAVCYPASGDPYTSAPTPDTSDNSTKIATTAYVKSNLNSYLPLSGGTMTGSVDFGENRASFSKYGHESAISIVGSSTDSGIGILSKRGSFSDSNLVLRSGDQTGTPSFTLRAGDGSTTKELFGKPDGTLTWSGKNVERVNASGTNYIRYESGLQICWGDLSVPGAAVSDETVTLPQAFKNGSSYNIVTGRFWAYNSSENYIVKSTTATNFVWSTIGTVSNNAHSYRYIAIGWWK